MIVNNISSSRSNYAMRYEVVRAHKSWVFLVLTIGSSLMQIMSVFSDGDSLSYVMDILNYIGSVFDMKTLIAFENTWQIVQLLSTVSGILMAVCMWELFIRSRNDTIQMLGVGRFMPVFHMINSVVVWIQTFIPLGLVWLAIYQLGGPTDWNQTAHQILFWVVIALSVVIVAVIHYHLQILTVTRIVTAHFSGKHTETNVPVLVIVESIVIGVCGMILSFMQRSGIGGFVISVVFLAASGMMMKVRGAIIQKEGG